MNMLLTPTLLSFKKCIFSNRQMQFFKYSRRDSRPFSATMSSSVAHTVEAHQVASGEATVSLQEWQGWGTNSPVPSMVTEVIEDLKLLQKDIAVPMDFGGNHGKLRGDFKVQEDKKHRAKYESLEDSEKKLQFFSARQIACRLLGSRGYLCQKVYSVLNHVLASHGRLYVLANYAMFSLASSEVLVVYASKGFLRQNNTGKLLWQVFGIQAATLCLFGITEQEEIMWNALNMSGRNHVWCLYPNKDALPNLVRDTFIQDTSKDTESKSKLGHEDEKLNFILIDGTWSNSRAMFKRLKDRAQVIWGEDLPYISLNIGVSLMHKLRPQPSWDRTCTAAAAIGLLCELHLITEFSLHGLDTQAEAMEDALEALLEALTARRLRMGRSLSRKERHNSNFC